MDIYNEHVFRLRVQEALDQLRLVLHSAKTFALPEDTPHSYADKYIVTNTISSIMIMAVFNLLLEVGLKENILETLLSWVNTSESSRSSEVSLRFESNEHCIFDKETTRSEENPHSVQSTNTFGLNSTLKSFTKITEYHFNFNFNYSLIAYRGVGAEASDRIELLSRSGSQPIVLRAKTAPYPDSDKKQFDVNIRGYLRHLQGANSNTVFEINRSHEKCFTPRRNPEVEALLGEVMRLHDWCSRVNEYLLQHLFVVQKSFSQSNVKPNLDLVSAKQLFIPVLPLLGSDGEAAVTLNPDDIASMLNEQRRSFTAKREHLEGAFTPPTPSVVISSQETVLATALDGLIRLCQHYNDAVTHIEAVINKQLIAAVGKVLSPIEFSEYMKFHYRRLFLPEFQPRPLSFAVRRSPDHSPEGAMRIEQSIEGKVAEPIFTFTKSEQSGSPMQFPLSASSKVTFAGERHLHLYLGHSFTGSTPSQLNLVAQARQFSSFILMVGRIASATEFDPKYAIILQNKDEVKIPLFLEQIPTAKEFRNAIQSLSPEQQQFAAAIRSMQLGGTVFGVLVIQIKPHLERLLHLKPDSLTKEIALGQNLMEMFIRYQIPSDLLSFDGNDGTEARTRVEEVTQHVEVIRSMVLKAKREEADEKELHDKIVFGNQPPKKESAAFARRNAPQMAFSILASERSSASPFDMNTVTHVEPRFVDQLDFEDSFDNSEILSRNEAPSSSLVEETLQEATDGPNEAPRAAEDSVDRDNAKVDFTSLPSQLDDAHDKLDPDSALRATIINTSDKWAKTSQKGLMQSPSTSSLDAGALDQERNAAFDLLDALSRSGASVLEDVSLHVVIASTHNFDLSLMDTVVKGNVNPIERVERSALILASTLHRTSTAHLLKRDQLVRVQGSSPSLFLTESTE